MTKSRRLRRLAPDAELFERRVAGESLRTLAHDYDVSHSTLLRYFRKPEVVPQLRDARRRVRFKRQALEAQRATERRLEQEVRRRAREQEQEDRELLHLRAITDARVVPRWSAHEQWLDEHDAPRGLLSIELWSESDRLADLAVAAGGGVDEIVAATRLRTRENVYRLIKPAIVARALANGRRRKTLGVDKPRLRRLRPDAELIRRRVEGEPLRRLANDYAVSHTTLSRYFAHPRIAEDLRAQRRIIRERRQREARLVRERTAEVREWTAAVTAQVRATVCPRHQRRPRIRARWNHPADLIAIECCCVEGAQELRRRLEINGIEAAAP